MLERKKIKKGIYSIALTIVVPVLLSGCYKVRYEYDPPESDADCPAGMDFRNGPSAVLDRNGGSAVVDRDGNDVTDFCYIPNCPGNWDDGVPAEIMWHQEDHHVVVAVRRCIP